jgi:hypothetical protein
MSERDPGPGHEPSASLHLERRTFVRLASDLSAACRPVGRRHSVSWPGKVRDISRGGIGLLLRHCFRCGTRLSIGLWDRAGTFLRTVQVRVVHVTPLREEGGPVWLLGCVFDQPLTEEELQALL